MRRLCSLQAGFTFTTNTKAIGVLQEVLPLVAYSIFSPRQQVPLK